MIASELIVGQSYFEARYADSSQTTPIILTYEFLGTGTLEDTEDLVFMFKYLPALTYPDDEERSEADAMPILLSEQQLEMLSIDELVQELMLVAERASRSAAP